MLIGRKCNYNYMHYILCEYVSSDHFINVLYWTGYIYYSYQRVYVVWEHYAMPDSESI